MRWAAWDVHAGADPEELQLTEFIPPPINPDAAARDSGPYARIALVPAWGAIVVAHSKASDDHIRLFGALLFLTKGCRCDERLQQPRSNILHVA